MLNIDVRLNIDVYDAVKRAAADRTEVAEVAAAVARTVTDTPAFGSEAGRIARSPGDWFDLAAMTDAGFWREQDALRDVIAERLPQTVATVAPYLPRVAGERVVPVLVHPVPGLTRCYGAPGGGQLFGLYAGTDPEEMLLFLSHTYYHELSATLTTPAGREAEADPSTAERFRRWLLLLIRHEGIANYAVLEPLRRLREQGCRFRYFTYAALVDNPEATARAMAACRQLLAMLDQETVDRVSRRVNAALKNPRLPVINLIGIHLAEAIARRHGVRALLDVDGREPEEFFQLYADTDDRLREDLFGPLAVAQS
jgi:putative zinc-dependent peptidase DUF5700